jgi:chorismate-pyruvate lyase
MLDHQNAGPLEVNLHRLLETFYQGPTGTEALGHFVAIESAPEPYQTLLNHHDHMTVTVEGHYGEPVDVKVHRTHRQGNWYSREITLNTSCTQRIVQYGIVRLKIDKLALETWREIESEQIPLGRVLIQHDVLRKVQFCQLWKVAMGQCLAALLHRPIGDTAYGRTALIYCDGEPTIELLEILTPIASEME